MCGIFGIYGPKAQTPPNCDNIEHRGPDSQGELRLNDLYFKHFRLAIIGEQKFASQPMLSRDGKIAIIFNGEIYNYKELASWLGNPSLAEEGDTRVLVELIAKLGSKCLPKLNGMFAFAAFNKETQSLIVARDRLGIKPLYYTTDDKSFIFSSEIKGFASSISLKMDKTKLDNYLKYASYPSKCETFYENIFQVAPGHFIEVSENGLNYNKFYDIQDDILKWIDKRPQISTYEELFENSIQIRMRSDVPVSLHYSGGTDSTALLLKMKEIYGKVPVISFTMAFEGEEDESCLTEKYCRDLGVENIKVRFDPEETPELSAKLSWLQDEPFGGIPAIAYYKMNIAERRQGFIVSLEGQGGDETLAGYLSHEVMGLLDMHEQGNAKECIMNMATQMNKPVEEIIKQGSAFFNSGFQGHVDMTDIRTSSNCHPDIFVDKLRTIQLNDITNRKIPRVLRFNDRSSMGAGREIRFPLLDHRVVACGVALKHEDKFSSGLGKSPLRKIIERHLPDVACAPKRSVVTPQTRWLKGCLKKWALERIQILRDSNKIENHYFDRVEDFYNNPDPQNSFPVWQLINLSYFIKNI
ncbi:asparagine synthase (glutamine-hydrolyzing) [Maridesulfovibrio bastinii]|uniref:asparagine synthase (glutamine-hydrolyzing) n=1 Tax=Maridesulfovibrio bastinii TaxID=47157 RepID=UPI00041075D5|nr:asparagine synthase (glutamine-hydrolyzing) [Maridesulfovibrio bastinii]